SPSSSRSGNLRLGSRILYSTGLPPAHFTQPAALSMATSVVPSSTLVPSLPLLQFQSANFNNVPLMTRSLASAAASPQPSSLVTIARSLVMVIPFGGCAGIFRRFFTRLRELLRASSQHDWCCWCAEFVDNGADPSRGAFGEPTAMGATCGAA